MTSYTQETKYYKARDGHTFTAESDCQNYEKFLDAKDKLKEMEDQWWKEKGHWSDSLPCFCRYRINPMKDAIAALLGMLYRTSSWYLFWPLNERDLEYCNTFKAVLELDPEMSVNCKINEFKLDEPYIIVTGAWDATITTPWLIAETLRSITEQEIRELTEKISHEQIMYIDNLKKKQKIAEAKAKPIEFQGTDV